MRNVIQTCSLKLGGGVPLRDLTTDHQKHEMGAKVSEMRTTDVLGATDDRVTSEAEEEAEVAGQWVVYSVLRLSSQSDGCQAL